MKKNILSHFLLIYLLSNIGYSQTTAEYVKSMNSLIPVTPEAASIMKSVDFPVSPFTGTADINIPIVTVKGNGISVPVSISYTSTDGVKVDEMAGNTGLGWVLSSGGEITREVRGAPDEGNGTAVGLINNPHSVSYYQSDVIPQTFGAPPTQTQRKVAKGELDLEPDIFYFSFCGRTGKFIYDEDLHKFVSMKQEPLNITFEQANNLLTRLTIVSDDGSTYIFDQRVSNAIKTTCNSISNPIGNPITTSWKLSKIVNADKTDSIILEYRYATYQYYGAGASTKYQLLPTVQGVTVARPNLNCFNQNNFTGFLELGKIYSSKDTLTAEYETSYRQDMPMFGRALSRIIFHPDNNASKQIYKFNYDYLIRSSFIGNIPDQTLNNKSLRLLQLINYGNSETNPYPLKWNFEYNNDVSLPGRLSYAQDFWGYPNSNTEPSTLASKEVMDYGSGTTFLIGGADRSVDPLKIQAGVLKKIQYPTGGTIFFNYEPNDVAEPVEFSNANVTQVSIDTTVFKGVGQQFSGTYSKSFVINQAPNPIVNFNNPDGGVYADINVIPNDPTSVNGNYNLTALWFELQGPSGQAFTNHAYGYYLKNGTYTMIVHNVPTMNTGPHINDPARVLSYSITYKEIDTSIAGNTNYQCGGLRIKSIITTDSLGGVKMKKEYNYHDPEVDTSYGQFVGATGHSNIDYWITTVTSASNYYPAGVYALYFKAMHGSSIVPGNNIAGAQVVYKKVSEMTTDGTSTYKKDFVYSVSQPIYFYDFPYCPPVFSETSHGKLLESNIYRTVASDNYAPAQRSVNSYSYNPARFSDNTTGFKKLIYGIHGAFAGFADGTTSPIVDALLIPPTCKLYSSQTERAYLTSDSTTTYNISNPNVGITEWHDYTYGDKNMQPMIVRSGNNSDGSVSIQKNYYASDMPEANTNIDTTFASQMVAANRLSQPLGTKQFKDAQLLNQQYTYGHFNGGKLLVDSMRQALTNNPLTTEIKVQSYSPFANPLSILLRGDKYRKYIWNDTLGLPLATCVMGQDSRFIFTSFEYPNEILWTATSRTTSNAFSGKYAYSLTPASAIYMPGLSSPTGMDVYVWSTGNIITANGSVLANTGKTKGNWTLYTVHLGNVASISLSATGALIDQLLVLPTGSQFQGNVYDSFNRVTAVVNDQIITSFYEYDNFGRLSTIRDEKGNIMKSTSYQYQGPQ